MGDCENKSSLNTGSGHLQFCHNVSELQGAKADKGKAGKEVLFIHWLSSCTTLLYCPGTRAPETKDWSEQIPSVTALLTESISPAWGQALQSEVHPHALMCFLGPPEVLPKSDPLTSWSVFFKGWLHVFQCFHGDLKPNLVSVDFISKVENRTRLDTYFHQLPALCLQKSYRTEWELSFNLFHL